MVTKNSGFTLIEVLITIAVAGALLGFGSINLSKYMQKLRLNQATTAFVASLDRMSDDALRFSQRIDLVESGLASGTIVWRSNTDVFGNIDLPHGAYVSTITKNIPSANIWFSGRGQPFQQVGFAVKLNNRIRRVVLLPTGIVVRQ